MRDAVLEGALAGVGGAAVQALYGMLSKVLGITDRSFTDFAKVLIMFHPYGGTAAAVVGILTHLTIGSLWGVLLALLVQPSADIRYYLKALGFAAILWVLLSGFGTVWKLPLFQSIPPNAALSTLVGSLIYGLTTALIYRHLHQETAA